MRLGREQLLASQQSTAAAVLELERDVRAAHISVIAAESIAKLQHSAATAADLSAQTADAFRAAGNISELQWSRERAAAMEAEIDAMRAADAASKSRAELYTLLGLAFQREAATAISVDSEMSLPPLLRDEPVALLEAGLIRLDIQAARARFDFATREGSLRSSSRFLDDLTIGFERESETGTPTKSGPIAAVGLPLFGLNNGKYLRAEAAAGLAKAELDNLEIALRNESWSVLASASAARRASTLMRERLVPLRARITELTHREFNFMFVGAFELLSVKREELQAYRQYLEAVRDEWHAHFEVQRVAGGSIPNALLLNTSEGARP
jgi:cobalt-zinc-cadmium efflux system outer membrane protein